MVQARPKNGPQSIGKSRGGWNTKVHLIAANDRFALTFSLSGGNAHDAPEGRALLASWTSPPQGAAMIMDRAYEGDEMRQLVFDLGIHALYYIVVINDVKIEAPFFRYVLF